MLSTNDIIYNFAIPAAVGMAIVFLGRLKMFAGTFVERHAATVAIVVGVFVCFHGLKLGPWIPAADRDWLPYVIIPAAILGPITLIPGVSVVERLPMYAISALAVAWFVVPTFEDLDPSYRIQFWTLAGTIAISPLLLEPVFERLPGVVTPGILAATAGGGAAVLMLSHFASYAQLSAAVGAVMGGMLLAAFFAKGTNIVRGTSTVFMAVLASLLLVGRANTSTYSSVPMLSYLLIPAAPLLMCVAAFGPAAKLSPAKRAAVQIILPLIAIGAAVALGVQAEYGGESEYPEY